MPSRRWHRPVRVPHRARSREPGASARRRPRDEAGCRPGRRRRVRPPTSARRSARLTRGSGRRSSRWARSQLVRPGAARRGTPVGKPSRDSLAPRAGESRLELAMPAAYRPSGANGRDRRLPVLPPRPEALERRVRDLRADRARRHLARPPRDPLPDRRRRRRRGERGRRSHPRAGLDVLRRPGCRRWDTANPRGLLDDAGWIAAWAPGWGSDRLRAGTGVALPAGSRIVMQVHYNLLNGRRPDRSRAVLTTVPGDDRAHTARRRRSFPPPSSSRAGAARAEGSATARPRSSTRSSASAPTRRSSPRGCSCSAAGTPRARSPRRSRRATGRSTAPSRSSRSRVTCTCSGARSGSTSIPASRREGSCSRSRAGASTGRPPTPREADQRRPR